MNVIVAEVVHLHHGEEEEGQRGMGVGLRATEVHEEESVRNHLDDRVWLWQRGNVGDLYLVSRNWWEEEGREQAARELKSPSRPLNQTLLLVVHSLQKQSECCFTCPPALVNLRVASS